jgi:hypothetical protein
MGVLICVKEALLTYATTLAFYLYLRASETYSQHPELLRSHPIFARLLQLKQALVTLEELDFDLSESGSGISDAEEDDLSLDDNTEDVSTFLKRHPKGAFDDLVELLREAEDAAASVKTQTMSKSATRLRPDKEPPKKKRKTPTAIKPSVFDLEEPEYVPSKHRTTTLASISEEDDAFGDAMALGTADAADKTARRHTLRFHTAKIESASARRQGARLALGGDDDLPYRERRKEKEARVQHDVQAGKRGQGGDDLDGIEPKSPARATGGADAGKDDESTEENVDGYYSLIRRQKREQKEAKKLAYDAEKAANRCVIYHQIQISDLTMHIQDGGSGRRWCARAPFAHSRDPEESWANASAVKERTQSTGEEAAKVCQGEESHCLAEACVQAWRRRFDVVWWGEIGHFGSREERSALIGLVISQTYGGVYFSFSIAQHDPHLSCARSRPSDTMRLELRGQLPLDSFA